MPDSNPSKSKIQVDERLTISEPETREETTMRIQVELTEDEARELWFSLGVREGTGLLNSDPPEAFWILAEKLRPNDSADAKKLERRTKKWWHEGFAWARDKAA